MHFDEERGGGRKAEKTANVPLSNTAEEEEKASEANGAQEASFFFSLLHLITKNFKYALECCNPEITLRAGDCKLACRVVVAGSVSSKYSFFAGKASEFQFMFANP